MACSIGFESQVIDDELAVNDAISELKQSNALLAVDCEGVSLSRKGELTILSIATREKAYIFDVFKIGKSIFHSGLGEILEDNSREKLMFDCRQDSDALFHQFTIKLDGVLDLQLLEIMYRRQNPGSTTSKPSSSTKSKKRSQNTDEVENINGYRRCLELYVEDENFIKVKDEGSTQLGRIANIWKHRPLSETLIQYCFVDTVGMFKLYDKMKDILSGGERSRLQIASEKYVDFYRSRNERSYDDYEANAFLPLDIIPKKGTPFGRFPRADTSCTCCTRKFPREEFSAIQLRKGEQKCRVCKAVKRRHDVQKNREDNWERHWEREQDFVDFPECGNDSCFHFGCGCD